MGYGEAAFGDARSFGGGADAVRRVWGGCGVWRVVGTVGSGEGVQRVIGMQYRRDMGISRLLGGLGIYRGMGVTGGDMENLGVAEDLESIREFLRGHRGLRDAA